MDGEAALGGHRRRRVGGRRRPARGEPVRLRQHRIGDMPGVLGRSRRSPVRTDGTTRRSTSSAPGIVVVVDEGRDGAGFGGLVVQVGDDHAGPPRTEQQRDAPARTGGPATPTTPPGRPPNSSTSRPAVLAAQLASEAVDNSVRPAPCQISRGRCGSPASSGPSSAAVMPPGGSGALIAGARPAPGGSVHTWDRRGEGGLWDRSDGAGATAAGAAAAGGDSEGGAGCSQSGRRHLQVRARRSPGCGRRRSRRPRPGRRPRRRRPPAARRPELPAG